MERTLSAVDDVAPRQPRAHAQREWELLVVRAHVGVAQAVHAAVCLVTRRRPGASRRDRFGIELVDRAPEGRNLTVREARGAAGVVRAREVRLERAECDVVLDRVVAPDPVHEDVAVIGEEASFPLDSGVMTVLTNIRNEPID